MTNSEIAQEIQQVTNEVYDKFGHPRNVKGGHYPFIPSPDVGAEGFWKELRKIGFFKARNFCDLGCGVGNILMLAKLENPALRCFGYERSSRLVTRGRKLAARLGLDVDIRHGDFMNHQEEWQYSDRIYMYMPMYGKKLDSLAKIVIYYAGQDTWIFERYNARLIRGLYATR